MRLELRKLRFRQPKLVATHLCLLFGSRESRHYVRANTFMGPDPNTQPGEARESRLTHASLISACERLSSIKSAATRGLSRTRSQILIGAFSLPSGAVPPESQRFLAARFRRPGSRGIALFLGILANDRAEHDMPASSLAER